MPLPLETERLRLRPLQKSDYDFMRILHTDARVMKYIGSSLTRTEAQTHAGMDRALSLSQENPLLGAWIAELRDTGVPIGNLLVRKPATQEETEGLEIGFSFIPSHWGQGYATEASRGIIEYIARHFGAAMRVVALIDPANGASRRTLTKLGFVPAGESQYVDATTGAVLPTEILELGGLKQTL